MPEEKIKKYLARWISNEEMGGFRLYTPWWVAKCTADDEFVLSAAFRARSDRDVEEIIYNCYKKRPRWIFFYYIEEKKDSWEPTDGICIPPLSEEHVRYWARPEYLDEE